MAPGTSGGRAGQLPRVHGDGDDRGGDGPRHSAGMARRQLPRSRGSRLARRAGPGVRDRRIWWTCAREPAPAPTPRATTTSTGRRSSVPTIAAAPWRSRPPSRCTRSPLPDRRLPMRSVLAVVLAAFAVSCSAQAPTQNGAPATTAPAVPARPASLQALLDAEMPKIPAHSGIWVKHLTTGEEGGGPRRRGVQQRQRDQDPGGRSRRSRWPRRSASI